MGELGGCDPPGDTDPPPPSDTQARLPRSKLLRGEMLGTCWAPRAAEHQASGPRGGGRPYPTQRLPRALKQLRAAAASVATRCPETFPKQAARRHGSREEAGRTGPKRTCCPGDPGEAELRGVLGKEGPGDAWGGPWEESGWGQCLPPTDPGPLCLPPINSTLWIKKEGAWQWKGDISKHSGNLWKEESRGQVTGNRTTVRPAGV